MGETCNKRGEDEIHIQHVCLRTPEKAEQIAWVELTYMGAYYNGF